MCLYPVSARKPAKCQVETLHNRWLAALQSGTPDCRGFRQWEQVGRKVKKGSKAVFILSPCTKKVEDAGEEKYICYGFRATPVFSADDTDGAPLTYETLETPNFPLLDVAARLGVDVSAIPGDMCGDAHGWYSPAKNAIKLASSDHIVFYHELVHAAHDRYMQQKNKKLNGGQDARQEIIAEFGAEVLAALFGTNKDTSGNSYQYIERYASQNGQTVIDACLSVLHEAAEVLTIILETKGGLE